MQDTKINQWVIEKLVENVKETAETIENQLIALNKEGKEIGGNFCFY